MSTSLARRFAQWCAALDGATIPPEVSMQARRAILDLLGVMLAGSKHATVAAIRNALAKSDGTSTVAGGPPSSASAAALVNGTAAHVLDFDDTSYTGIMHGSAVVFPAVLAAAEGADLTDEELIHAFIVGSELAYTLADVASHNHYFKGWWSTATFGLIGATAGVARVYALDATATMHAIGMAAASAGGGKCLFGTDTKAFLVGETARRAIDLANAAAAGLTGPANAFEDSRGFFALLNGGEARLEHADTLGKRWRLLDPGLLFKLNPVCSAAHAAIETTSNLMGRSGASVSDIAAIRCEVSQLVKISLVFDRPESPQEAQFSLPYAVACAALHGRVRLQDLEPAEVVATDKKSLMEKVEMRVSPELSSEQCRSKYPESTKIVLTLNSAETFEEFCGEAYGMPGRPLSAEHLWGKFVSCGTYAGVQSRDLDRANMVLDVNANDSRAILGAIRSLLGKAYSSSLVAGAVGMT